jgi:hypothetical protein
VTGLAAAAVDATKKVEGLLDDDSDLLAALRKMREEAEELDGFEFLTMTEAGAAEDPHGE